MRQLSNTLRQENTTATEKDDRLGDINDHLPFLLEKLAEELNFENLDISNSENANLTLVAINKMIKSIETRKEMVKKMSIIQT